MGLLDKPKRVRVHVHLDAEQQAEIERIAKRENAPAAEVHRAALTLGLPAVAQRLNSERLRGSPSGRR